MALKAHRAILPALAAAALLAGCGSSPGTAAVIDGERMTEDEAQELTAELNAVFGQELTVADTIAIYAQTGPILDAAESLGVSASEAQVEDLLAQQAETNGYTPEDGQFLEDTVYVGRGQVVSQPVQQDPDALAQVGEAIGEMEIDLNPRYGTVESGGFIPPQPDWLVEPVQDQQG
ncbi:hypothetical protein CZ771_07365 [Actinomycetales bacterium JB111]|nr:hypothetical protein CZ771_07365 [Actinomycetales bacterium JB111]